MIGVSIKIPPPCSSGGLPAAGAPGYSEGLRLFVYAGGAVRWRNADNTYRTDAQGFVIT